MYLSEDAFYKFVNEADKCKILSVDTEGTTNHPYSETWGLSISYRGVSEYFAFYHLEENLPEKWLPVLKQLIESRDFIVMHNAKHDLQSLWNLGIYVNKFYCTMVMAHWIDENIHDKRLESLSKLYGGEPKAMPERMKHVIQTFGYKYIPMYDMRPYGAQDAYITDELFYKLMPEFQGQEFDGELWDDYQEFIRFVIDMERIGVPVDQDLSRREYTKGLGVMKEKRDKLGVNPGSPKDLHKLLIDELKLPVVSRSKKTNAPSFDKAAMEVYDELLEFRNDERAQDILTYRGWQKSTSSNYKPYLDLVGPDGRLRPNFNLHKVKTGRMSCDNPNLQQIPKISDKPWNGQLKKAFCEPEGMTSWEFDYRQLELRLGIHYAAPYYHAKDLQDTLTEVFNDPDRDIFSEIAEQIGMTRDNTKTLVYMLDFGGGINKMKSTFGLSHQAAHALREQFFNNYPGLAWIMNKANARARENGYIKYWSGRRRHFKFKEDMHKAYNSLIQGGGFEIVRKQMTRLRKEGLFNKECHFSLQVHDSVRADIEEGKEHIYKPEIKRVLEDTPPFRVPFETEVKRWATKG